MNEHQSVRVRMLDCASQENCDSEPYDLLQEGAEHIRELEAELKEEIDNALNMVRDLDDYKVMIKEREKTIYDLQMSDTHLEFISRVQDVGMHHDWIEFTDALEMAEKQLS